MAAATTATLAGRATPAGTRRLRDRLSARAGGGIPLSLFPSVAAAAAAVAVAAADPTAATTTTAPRLPPLPYARVPKTGLLLSALGLGAFRIGSPAGSPHAREELAAVKAALAAGVNVLDTAGHFKGGNSERLLGRALREAIAETALQRDEVAIITKCGYIPPLTGGAASHPCLSSAEMADVGATGAHSLAPRFVERELSDSLDRLGVDTVDVYMLNNPERMVLARNQKYTPTRVLDALRDAFVHLEREVARGRIAGYGVASNALHARASAAAGGAAPPLLALDDVVRASREAWEVVRSDTSPAAAAAAAAATVPSSSSPHFVAVEFPLNLFERAARFPAEEDGVRRSLVEAARALGLYQFTQRPLTAIAGGQVRHLGESIESVESDDQVTQQLAASFEKITELEMDLSGLVSQSPADLAFLSKFVWAQALAENLSYLAANPIAATHFIDATVLPALRRDLGSDEFAARAAAAAEDDGDGGGEGSLPQLQEWARRYEAGVTETCARIKEAARRAEREENRRLASVLGALAPARAVAVPAPARDKIEVEVEVEEGENKDAAAEKVAAALREPVQLGDFAVRFASSCLRVVGEEEEEVGGEESLPLLAGTVLVGMRRDVWVFRAVQAVCVDRAPMRRDELQTLDWCPLLDASSSTSSSSSGEGGGGDGAAR
ncbi:hypothetical protein DFJ73DRAFT_960430 [Zopfochytrium polystomum]|nr:hypothetical protein DFJ73DRAFT_960430 [Zopfochytrium polystomum]